MSIRGVLLGKLNQGLLTVYEALMSKGNILLVTGKLAEPALRRQVASLSLDAHLEIAVLPITVVALASTSWIARHLSVNQSYDRVILPGLCQGSLDILESKLSCPVERGPKELRDLPLHFGQKRQRSDYGKHDIEILAEINHAPRLTLDAILDEAKRMHQDGADLIDLGCDPDGDWAQVGEVVRALRQEGMRVSIDSFNPSEVEQAIEAGAELVLSVNSSNCERALDWDCEVVVIPDDPKTLQGLDATIERLASRNVRFRVDPILEPIAFGFADSLGRYLDVRRRYPEVEMMMGVGNVTELTDVDSVGVNVTLLGFCQEQGIRSVLTTQVINWCRSCVKELDLARRLVHHAVEKQILPKHLEDDLILLRDPQLASQTEEEIAELQSQIADRNFRIFAESGLLHILNHAGHWRGEDPFALFAAMQAQENVDASHAFYLGYEMAKAVTALTLGKRYAQDQSLRWGFLTVEEKSECAKDSDSESEEGQ